MTVLEQPFERLDAGARKARLSAVLQQLPPTRADGERSVRGEDSLAQQVAGDPVVSDTIPLLGPLTNLVPGGLRRGEVVQIRSRQSSVDYLSIALLAGALAAGLWASVIGASELGGVALAEMLAGCPNGADGLDRLLLVPDPGPRWSEVLVQMAAGVDLVLLRPPAQVAPTLGRAVDARLRQGRAGTRHSAAVLVLGQWASARTTLHTERTEWTGLHETGPFAGTGHLTGGRATVSATGRGASGRREVQLWMPSSTGSVRPLEETAAKTTGRPRLTAVA
jgi:hypothetical protein